MRIPEILLWPALAAAVGAAAWTLAPTALITHAQVAPANTLPPGASPIVINELRLNQPGADDDEFFELAGPPGTSLDGHSFLIVSGEFAPGVVERAVSLDGFVVQADGVFAFGDVGLVGVDATGAFDPFGSPATYMLVERFTGAEGDDLDLNDDGVIDVLPFDAVLDAVSFLDGDMAPDRSYGSSAIIAPDGSFGAAHAFRDVRGAFQPGGFANLGADTPGAPNTAVGPILTLASAIQGSTPADGDASNDASPLAGTRVTVEGIVVADFQSLGLDDGDLGGFYLQEEGADADADPTTSEAVFVVRDDLDVRVGDVVQVNGVVAETDGRTEIQADGTVTRLDVATALPPPIRISLPAAAAFDVNSGSRTGDFEAVEGMRVIFPQALTVTEAFQLDSAGQLRLAQGGRFLQFTQTNDPSVTGFANHLDDLAKRTVVLDDGLETDFPSPVRFPRGGFSNANTLRIGDATAGLVGVFHSGASGARYRLMPTETPNIVPVNRRPAVPDVGGSLKVVSFNVLNYFNTLADGAGSCFQRGSFSPGNCRGAGSQMEFERQTDKLVRAMIDLDATVYGLLELENDIVDGGNSSLAELTRALSARGTRSCQGDFDYVDPGVRVGDDAIAVGFIYCPSRLRRAPGSQPAVLRDADLASLSLSFSSTVPVFDGSSTSRSPLAASFEDVQTGGLLTVAVNHFKSKGGAGLGDDANAGDGQGAFNGTRTRSAEALAAWLDTDPTGAGTDNVLIIGDLNAYPREAPLQTLEAAGYADLVGGGYSFVFDGQAGSLDYALASAALQPQVTGASDWHSNADEPDLLDYNLDNERDASIFSAQDPWRSSDHDPLLVGMTVSPVQVTTVLAEDFSSGDLGGFTATSSASSANWGFRNDQSGTTDDRPAARINGFGADTASRDWLISGDVAVPAAGSTTLSFDTFVAFDGGDFQVYVLGGFAGDPETATQTLLTWNKPADNSRAWTPSGPIDLSSFAGQTVRIAFLYTSTGTGGGDGADWSVSNIRVENFRGLRIGFTQSARRARVGESVSFDASAQGGMEPYTFGWDFGDGTTAAGQNVTHRYMAPGTFTSTLTVTDMQGTVQSTRSEVLVVPANDDMVPMGAGDVRVATFNASLNRGSAGALAEELRTSTTSRQAGQIAEIIQRVRPDVVLINEFDYDSTGTATARFASNYLEVGQNGAMPISYPFVYTSTVNTGVPSGLDLNNDGNVGGANDAFGFGFFPGQFGMAVFSRFPIETAGVRTFQTFKWQDMPGALLPRTPGEGPGAGELWYSEEELDAYRLSSKSHWDLPVDVNGTRVHILAAHPTPPVFDDGTLTFDGVVNAIDFNGLRNHDEIRFWADYVTPGRSEYIYDDAGTTGGLGMGERFVIVGDYNADPFDGDSTANAAVQFTNHPEIQGDFTPGSKGGLQQSAIQGDVNAEHRGNPSFDTADFGEPPGNLRVDYVLASEFGLDVVGGGVFWPEETNLLFDLVAASDHRLVFLDLDLANLGTLVRSTDEPAGANCENGGVRLDSGRDLNGNGEVDDTEVEATRYICDGGPGMDGTNGMDGMNGADGMDGSAGPQGPQGPPGPQGESGAAGPFMLALGLAAALLERRRRSSGPDRI